MTAEEFLFEKLPSENGKNETKMFHISEVIGIIKLFAQYHVKQALLEASNKAQAKENPKDYGTGEIWIDEESILNSYPDDRIK